MNTTVDLHIGQRMLVLLFITFLVMANVSYGQDSFSHSDNIAYQKAIETEFTEYGANRYLYDHADAYQRLIQIRALRRMGFNFNETTSKELVTESSPGDSSMTKDVSSAGTSDQNETTIAISHSNSQIIVAGANDIPGMIYSGMPAYYTVDGGKTWSFSRVPRISSSYETLGDPSIVSGDSGYFYYAYLAGVNGSGSGEDNLLVASSKDGKKWINGGYVLPPDQVGGFEDKENICVDNSPLSPHFGRIYLAWLHFDGSSSLQGGHGAIAWSDDRGKTWSHPLDLMDSLVRFSEVRTGKNGEVFVTFSLVDESTQTGTHFFLVSTDGGVSFQRNSIANFKSYPINQTNYPGLKGYSGFRAFPYVAQDVDLKTNKIHLVYGTWHDDGTGVIPPAAALYYMNSTDLGKHWTNPITVGVSNPQYSTLDHDRFCPWVSVNQQTDEAYCFYYSSERDPDNLLVAAFREKLDGYLTDYPEPLEVSDFDPSLLVKTQHVPFIGDYQGSDFYDSVYAASWTEGKGETDGDVFVYIQLPGNPQGVASVPIVIQSQNIWLSSPIPNPVSTSNMTLHYYLPHDAHVDISIFSSSGVKVMNVLDKILENGSYTDYCSVQNLASGTYILRMSTPYGSTERNIVILH